MKISPKNLSIIILVICFLSLHFCINLNADSPKEILEKREKFVEEALSLLGSPYKYGGYEKDGFDCSGLVFYSSRESIAHQLPRTAKAIYKVTKVIDYEDCQKGDLLFFKTTSSGNISHVGIYIGNGEFVSAICGEERSGVVISSMEQPYWQERFFAAGRFLPEVKDL